MKKLIIIIIIIIMIIISLLMETNKKVQDRVSSRVLAIRHTLRKKFAKLKSSLSYNYLYMIVYNEFVRAHR